MTLKKHQNPKGGLNEAGRKFFKRKEGANLKRPVKSGDNPRRASFLARMSVTQREDPPACFCPSVPGVLHLKEMPEKRQRP
jgi:hypothetical protein